MLVGAMSAGLSTGASAQDFEEDEDDEIVVTGSRIVRQDNYTAVGPVNVLAKEDIDIAAKSTLGDFLEELPSVSFSGDGTNVNNGSGGLQTINLRGLGADRLLVLMNGRRVSPVGSGINNLVDLAIFPQAAVDRIEVLKDGAAAVYGADAVSGVLNIITTKDFEGIDLTARAATSERGDGEQYNIGATFGVAMDRGSAQATISYTATEGVYQSDRDISNCPRLDPGTALWVNSFGGPFADATQDPLNSCSGSSFTPQGRFWLGPTASGPSGTVDADGTFRGFSFFTGDAYNFNPLNYLRTPNTAFTTFTSANYDITDSITAEMELMYNKRTSKQDLAPVPLGAGAQFTYGLIIPGNNPYNVVGSDITYRKRMLDVGPRLFDQESDTIRTTLALKGTVGDDMDIPFLSGASWEAAWTGDFNQVTDKNGNLIDMLRVQNALNLEQTAVSGAGTVTVNGDNYRCADPIARSLGCVPLNLFGPNSITTEAADYIRLNTVDKFASEGRVASFTVSNSLMTLPAGDVGAVIGVERRSLQGSQDIDAAIANGISSGNPAQSTDGQLKAWDFFGEIEVPLVADKPFMEELTFNGAYRISDYDTFEAGDTYRLSLAWSPIEDLRFRGGVATSFRTPGLGELFSGGAGGFPVYDDPCFSFDPADVAAATAAGICATEGITPGTITQDSNQVLSFTTGARIVGTELDPERGKTITLGAVYRPSSGFLNDYNFEAAVDYFDITIKDSITTTGTQATINNCYLTGDAQACSQVQRAFGGDILRVNTSFTNTQPGEETSSEGIDFSFRGSTEAFGGDMGLNVQGTHTLERGDTDEDGFFSDFAGQCFGFTASCSNDWRVNASLSWSNDNFRGTWTTRYLSAIKRNGIINGGLDRQGVFDYYTSLDPDVPNGGYGLDPAVVTDEILDAYFIPDFFYHDVNVRYEFANDLQLSAGVDNIFDKDAPLYKYTDDFFNPTENSAIGTYSTLGRFFYIGIDKKF